MTTVARLLTGTMMMVIALTGCKKDDNGGNGNTPDAKQVLPAVGTYTYRTAGADGSTENMTQTVLNERDSANGKAVTIRSMVDTAVMEAVVFADASFTTYAINPPASFYSAVYELQSIPGVTEFNFGGWPVYQRITNNPGVNDALTFSGGPVFIHAALESEGETITTDFRLAFINGKAIRTSEPVTTPAGQFNCTVWAYETESTFSTGYNGQTSSEVQHFKDTVWYAQGVGMVKSRESSEAGISETVLTAKN